MRRNAERGRWLLAAVAAASLAPLAAQNVDAPRAPRIIGGPAPAAPAPTPAAQPSEAPPAVSLEIVRRPPNTARLAAPPANRNDAPEEIIVIGQGWRLPDLGSEWRQRQKEAASSGTFSATALPLYDPGEPPQHTEAFTSREQRRHGYIELFRLRFGRRSRDDDDEQGD